MKPQDRKAAGALSQLCIGFNFKLHSPFSTSHSLTPSCWRVALALHRLLCSCCELSEEGWKDGNRCASTISPSCGCDWTDGGPRISRYRAGLLHQPHSSLGRWPLGSDTHHQRFVLYASIPTSFPSYLLALHRLPGW